MSKISAKITGIGFYAPEKILTNKDLEKMVETTDEWIKTRTGMSERHIADEKTATSDLATQAALRAIEMAKIKPEEIDIIMVGTVSPDMAFPSSACFVQNNIKATKAAAFDLSAACSGFIYGLTLAKGMIVSGEAKTILVIPHQANIRIIESIAKRMKLPPEKVFINLEKYGNTSSASIPIAMTEAYAAGRLKKGDILVITAFGAGLTMGAAVIKWSI